MFNEDMMMTIIGFMLMMVTDCTLACSAVNIAGIALAALKNSVPLPGDDKLFSPLKGEQKVEQGKKRSRKDKKSTEDGDVDMSTPKATRALFQKGSGPHGAFHLMATVTGFKADVQQPQIDLFDTLALVSVHLTLSGCLSRFYAGLSNCLSCSLAFCLLRNTVRLYPLRLSPLGCLLRLSPEDRLT